MQFQKMSILPPQKGFEFPGGGVGSPSRPKNSRQCLKLIWNFHKADEGNSGYLALLLSHTPVSHPVSCYSSANRILVRDGEKEQE